MTDKPTPSREELDRHKHLESPELVEFCERTCGKPCDWPRCEIGCEGRRKFRRPRLTSEPAAEFAAVERRELVTALRAVGRAAEDAPGMNGRDCSVIQRAVVALEAVDTALHPISAGEGKGGVAKICQIEMRHTFDEIASWKGGPAWAEKCHEDRGWLLEQLAKKPEPAARVPVTPIAEIIAKASADALYNGAGKVINPEVFDEAAATIASLLASSPSPAAQGAAGMGEEIAKAHDTIRRYTNADLSRNGPLVAMWATAAFEHACAFIRRQQGGKGG